jgi:hypothetical protein
MLFTISKFCISKQVFSKNKNILLVAQTLLLLKSQFSMEARPTIFLNLTLSIVFDIQ